MESGKERRKDLRSDIQMKVACSLDESNFDGVSMNISKGGMLLKTDNVLALNSQLALEFTLPYTTVPMNLDGVVVWRKIDDAESDIQSGEMGVQFQWQYPLLKKA